jgi:imidazolonepropionase-like amidohydrolase
MIKTYRLSADAYFTVLDEARRRGIPVGGHIYVPAAEATDSGARIIDHYMESAGGLDTLCLIPPASRERCRAMAERLRRNDTWWILTLLWDLAVRNGSVSNALRPAAMAEKRDKLAVLVASDVPLLAGTDVGIPSFIPPVLPDSALVGELALHVEGGLTPLAALQMATLNPAKFLHGTDSLGTVAPGKLADLVLLDADPLADIWNVAKIRAVVANGRYYDRATLDRLRADATASLQADLAKRRARKP